MRIAAIAGLAPQGYERHPLHRTERAWPETNCYADLWIEVLHALKLDPVAGLGFTVGVDFEGDQWTFFKPAHSDLTALYGVDVQELNIWRPLLDHVVEQAGRGRLVLAEVDAHFLPDTAGTDYRSKHSKTTIAVQAVDVEAERLEYFHNAGFFELSGEDFRGLFAAAVPPQAPLPPYVEFAKLGAVWALPAAELEARAQALLREHLARAPRSNPFAAFAPRFARDVEQLQQGVLPDYHLYAFATLRQAGAAFELAAEHARWLAARGAPEVTPAIAAFEAISTSAKAMILKTARAVTLKRATDFQPLLAAMAEGWDSGMGALRARFGS